MKTTLQRIQQDLVDLWIKKEMTRSSRHEHVLSGPKQRVVPPSVPQGSGFRITMRPNRGLECTSQERLRSSVDRSTGELPQRLPDDLIPDLLAVQSNMHVHGTDRVSSTSGDLPAWTALDLLFTLLFSCCLSLFA